MGVLSLSSLTRRATLTVMLVLTAGWAADAQPIERRAALNAAAEPAPRFASLHFGQASDRSADRWIARDKLRHVTFSFLWTLSAQYVLVDKADWSRRSALPAAAGSSAAVGLSKELFDWRIGPTSRFSTRDLTADAVGIALAVGVIVL